MIRGTMNPFKSPLVWLLGLALALSGLPNTNASRLTLKRISNYAWGKPTTVVVHNDRNATVEHEPSSSSTVPRIALQDKSDTKTAAAMEQDYQRALEELWVGGRFLGGVSMSMSYSMPSFPGATPTLPASGFSFPPFDYSFSMDYSFSFPGASSTAFGGSASPPLDPLFGTTSPTPSPASSTTGSQNVATLDDSDGNVSNVGLSPEAKALLSVLAVAGAMLVVGFAVSQTQKRRLYQLNDVDSFLSSNASLVDTTAAPELPNNAV